MMNGQKNIKLHSRHICSTNVGPFFLKQLFMLNFNF